MTIDERIQKITFLIMDVDGVLTDGRMVYDNQGNQLKFFDVHDGMGIAVWKKAGLKCGIITGKKSQIVVDRAKEFDVDVLRQNSTNKNTCLQEIIDQFNLKEEEICYIGDDLVDFKVMKRVGFSVGVNNACKEIKEIAHYVTEKQGGRGAVREAIELILKAQSKWNGTINLL